MGVNKLLKAGIAKENMQLKGESARKETRAAAKKEKTNEEKRDTVRAKTAAARKNRGGRPTNKEIGIQSRKQYSLTLKEEDYNLFLKTARENDLSFAKFMEKAAFEYIKNYINE